MRVLVCVITGGRTALADRCTRLHFDSLREHGFSDIEWVVREDHAGAYECDDNPLNVYPLDWANGYSRAHWRHPVAKWEPGGFHGAFTGREWAMRSAEQRGFDAVLQLDDNVRAFGVLGSNTPAYRDVISPGLLAHLLVEISASTNVRMLGAQLNSATPERRMRVTRVGYPYSVFVERCGRGRIPYYGPFEDDIMHALDYGLSDADVTAGLVEPLRYVKQSGGKTGMRSRYNAKRGLEIAKRYPNNVRLGIGRATSSTSDPNRGMRHFLRTTGFTPVRVTDRERFAAAEKTVRDLVAIAVTRKREWDREKIARRASGDDAAVDSQPSGQVALEPDGNVGGVVSDAQGGVVSGGAERDAVVSEIADAREALSDHGEDVLHALALGDADGVVAGGSVRGHEPIIDHA